MSNNSTAYSDESNDETEGVCNRSHGSETSKSVLKTHELNSPEGKNEDDSTSQSNLSAKNLDLNISTSSESVRTSDAERVNGEQSTPRLGESPVNEKRSPSPSRTFITNVKQFLSKRFSSTNLKDIQKVKQDTELNNLEKKLSANSLNGRAIDPMERYRQILEDHKDLLPKDFTIRKFPYSSCEDTFDPKSMITSPTLPTDEDSCSQKDIKITFDLNSNVVVNDGAKHDEPDTPAANPEPAQATNGNNLNKRFYHVFKKNELDDLIRDNCADLVKTSSYNDHGNWCWVGHKIE